MQGVAGRGRHVAGIVAAPLLAASWPRTLAGGDICGWRCHGRGTTGGRAAVHEATYVAGVTRAGSLMHEGVDTDIHPVRQGHIHDDGLDEHLRQQAVDVADDLVDFHHILLVGEDDERIGAVVGDDSGILQNLDVAAGGTVHDAL